MHKSVVETPAWEYPDLIINAALTGMIPNKLHNTHVPISPDEIAADAKRCHDAGASIVHIHAREKDGTPTWNPDIYSEIIGKIRNLCPDLIICASTSGRDVQELEKRAAVLYLEDELKPDMGSLTLGSLNFPKQASVNPPHIIQSLAKIMQEREIKPELEVFDLGMLDYANYLINKSILKPPFYFNLFLGSLGTLNATPANLNNMVSALPEGATWGATGIGKFQHNINALAIASSGNVRVGLEDNIWYDAQRTELASNPRFVERLVKFAHSMGREIAGPEAVRAQLKLPNKVQASCSQRQQA